ncbi:putative gustatory receptor 28a [Microplitis mediator]|uniref:putative gustatory receptor 28a n=1 Tax=Microplitis mediator TaxID=375433 RepID=UPI0025525A5A|nr:putative gustatory receptor 28a [Microplitis mediator]
MNQILKRIKFIKFNFKKYGLVCNRYLLFMLHIWFKLLGLSPWKMDTNLRINTEIRNKGPRFHFSYVGSCYNILVFVIIVVTAGYILRNLLPFYGDHSTFTVEVLSINLKIFSMLCTSVIPLLYIVRQQLYKKILNKFETLDNKLNKCADFKTENDNINYLIFSIYIVIMCCMVILRQLYFKALVTVMLGSFPDFIVNGLIIQYAMLLNIIKIRFKNVNSILSKLGTSESRISLSRTSVLDDIGRIKSAYVDLCEMCEDIVSFYGMPVLIEIIVISLKTIYNLYYIVLIFLDLRESENIMCLCVLLSLWYNFVFTALATNVSKIVKQNKKTAMIINLLLDRYAMDEEIKQKLTQFASDHWHLTVEFTACDIVPLDRTLLAIINGTIATYLVIAVQFRISAIPD